MRIAHSREFRLLRAMESSRIAWIAFSLLALVLAAAPGRADDPVSYSVGNLGSIPNWFPQVNRDLYQNWADQLTLYINDSLVFQYNSPSDVTRVYTLDELNSCSIANGDVYSTDGEVEIAFVASGTFYITSSGGTTNNISSDCEQGMHFFVNVVSRDSSPSLSPAPPPQDQGALAPTQGGTPQASTITIQWERSTSNFIFHQDLIVSSGASFVLLFNYTGSGHDVRRVDQSDYASCNPTRPLAVYTFPNKLVTLEQEDGYYYFIDGIGNNCANGNIKLMVQVGNGSSPGPGKTTSAGKAFPVAAVAVPVVILVLALVGFLFYRWRYGSRPRPERRVVSSVGFGKSGDSGQASAAISGILKGNAAGLAAIFTYAELERATKSFSADNVVGTGGFGTVYKGTLDDGRTVAIKLAKPASDVGSFVNEVAILSQVNNRNLVKLLGCCIEVDIPLLVYEYISNGTLLDHLSTAQKGFNTRLDWNTRFRIALQTAEALKYLHVQATPPIFHRDVKTANILLDDHFNAKVADFGLSKLVDLEATHVSTVVKGTPGYLDPEYFHNFQLTDKTDVYSFGVVLLELITSKKPIDLSNPAGEQNLAVCSVPLIRSGRVREIIDSHMSSSLSRDELQAVDAVAQVAVACLVSSRASRPSMSEVVEMLQRIKGSKLKAEEFYRKADVTDSEHTLIQMQASGISLGYSGSTTMGTSSSDSGTVIEMTPR